MSQLRIRIYRCLFCFLCWDPNLELLFHLLLNTHLSLVGPKLWECCQVCRVARSGLPELKFRWFPAVCFFARGLLEILEFCFAGPRPDWLSRGIRQQGRRSNILCVPLGWVATATTTTAPSDNRSCLGRSGRHPMFISWACRRQVSSIDVAPTALAGYNFFPR